MRLPAPQVGSERCLVRRSLASLMPEGGGGGVAGHKLWSEVRLILNREFALGETRIHVNCSERDKTLLSDDASGFNRVHAEHAHTRGGVCRGRDGLLFHPRLKSICRNAQCLHFLKGPPSGYTLKMESSPFKQP